MALFHIPHASRLIPDEDHADFVVSPAVLEHDQNRLVDHFTDELYLPELDSGSEKSVRAVVAPVSRLVVDMERFANDDIESSSKVGMGATYVQTTKGEPLRVLSADRREELLAKYYYPHHEALDKMAQEALDEHGICVVLDCHSFPVTPLPTQTSFLDVSPEICIGTDTYHTSDELRDFVVAHFKDHGFEVDVNKPFAGSLVPNKFYRKDKRVQSVMVELRRDIYMNEETGKKTPGEFERVQYVLAELQIKLVAFVERSEVEA